MPLIETVNNDTTIFKFKEFIMRKLLSSYAKNPSIKLVRRIEAYARKHPFSLIALTQTEQNVLDDVLLLAENI
tara:strand:- start:369 stop:587 length:219 start_codon:yes stop_codon:yes gene_type:complete